MSVAVAVASSDCAGPLARIRHGGGASGAAGPAITTRHPHCPVVPDRPCPPALSGSPRRTTRTENQ